MKPIKAKVLLQNLENQLLNRPESGVGSYDFLTGASAMIELLLQQGIISKGQDQYLQTGLTQIVHRDIARKNEERRLHKKGMQEKSLKEEKALQEKREQECTWYGNAIL